VFSGERPIGCDSLVEVLPQSGRHGRAQRERGFATAYLRRVLQRQPRHALGMAPALDRFVACPAHAEHEAVGGAHLVVLIQCGDRRPKRYGHEAVERGGHRGGFSRAHAAPPLHSPSLLAASIPAGVRRMLIVSALR